jgi:hypothetical protein
MISNFFVLSPRGDTIIAKQYRNDRGDAGAHERSHTEAFFRKIKFWDDMSLTPGAGNVGEKKQNAVEDGRREKGDAPPVFMMPDGLTYMHVKRNGLIFGCATARNASPTTVIEVRAFKISNVVYSDFVFPGEFSYTILSHFLYSSRDTIASLDRCPSVQGLLRDLIGGSNTKELHLTLRAFG